MAGLSKADAKRARDLVAVTQAGSHTFASEKEMANLAKAGLVEMNANMRDPNDASKFAFRATAAALSQFGGANAPAEGAGEGGASGNGEKPTFTIDADIPVPDIVRGGAVGQRAAVYPFDSLPEPVRDANGKVVTAHSFFIPATAERPNPAKMLASTVSSATKRFAEPVTNPDGSPVMEAKTVKEAVVDANGNEVKGADGKVVKRQVTKQVPKLRLTRQFTIRAVDETAQGRGKGARVWRIA
jgi:hypothetical protein